MATPIITSVTVDPPAISECESATITIIANETVSGDIVLLLTVTNTLGEATLRDVIVPMTGSGPLTYSIVASQGTVEQHPTQPNVFTYHAPCPDDPTHDPITHTNHPH